MVGNKRLHSTYAVFSGIWFEFYVLNHHLLIGTFINYVLHCSISSVLIIKCYGNFRYTLHYDSFDCELVS